MTNVLLIFVWLVGLVFMPGATFAICKSIPQVSTIEIAQIRLVAGWGMVLTGAWFVLVGYIVIMSIGLSST